MEENNGKMTEFLAQHPKLIGAVFAIMLALSNVGMAAANSHSTIIGP